MQIFQVDAFTNQVFKGNPAGVCILPPDKMKDDWLLQNIAAEMNLSETAFLVKQGNQYQLRWFTPETEVDLCGHATLSAAHILWETGIEDKQQIIHFNTLSGKLYARFKRNKIELDFPAFEVEKIPNQPNINQVLGINPVFTGMSRRIYLMEVADYAVLNAMRPDFIKLKEYGRTAFIITCRSDNP